MMDTKTLESLCGTIRTDALRMTTGAQSGHPSSCLSCAEIIGVLILDIMNIDPMKPEDPCRDRFVLSKGHAAPAYYSALSLKGFISRDELVTLRSVGSRLQGHPDMNKTPGVDFSTGSLGMGLSVANGMALACRLQGHSDATTYVLLGDGELQEGQVWEAAMSASHHGLSRVVAIIDRNMLQCDGTTEEIKALEPLSAKFQSFGWNVFEVDGHDVAALQLVLRQARDATGPSVIIAATVKGKGVSCMAGKCNWHGKPLSSDACDAALRECSL